MTSPTPLRTTFSRATWAAPGSKSLAMIRRRVGGEAGSQAGISRANRTDRKPVAARPSRMVTPYMEGRVGEGVVREGVEAGVVKEGVEEGGGVWWRGIVEAVMGG